MADNVEYERLRGLAAYLSGFDNPDGHFGAQPLVAQAGRELARLLAAAETEVGKLIAERDEARANLEPNVDEMWRNMAILATAVERLTNERDAALAEHQTCEDRIGDLNALCFGHVDGRDLEEMQAQRDAAEGHWHDLIEQTESWRIRLLQAFDLDGATFPALISIAELAWKHGNEHKARADSAKAERDAALADLERARPVLEAAKAYVWAWRALDTYVGADLEPFANAMFAARNNLVAAHDAYRASKGDQT
jgi:hypothetical protein